MKTVNYPNIFYVAALALMLLSGCTRYPAYNISELFFLNRESLDMFLGDTARIIASPRKASYAWSSENDTIASVDSEGLVEALNYGFTTIYVKSGATEQRIDVHVKEYIPLTKINVAPDSVELSSGNSVKIWAYPYPVEASEYSFKWRTEDPAVATVDQNGTIYAIAGGRTNIVVSSGEVETKIPVVVVFAESILQKAIGYWLFDDPDNLMKATIGEDLEPLVIPGDWPINYYPVSDSALKAITVTRGTYLYAYHRMPAGPARLQYSLMFDFRIPKTGEWYAFYQTTDAAFSGDAECFIDPNNKIGVNIPGYSAKTVSENIWYRLVIAVNLPSSYDIYLDGERIFTTPQNYLSYISESSRFALSSVGVCLFVDGGGANDGPLGDDNDIDVSALAMWNYRLTDTEIGILGKANKYERE